MGGERPTSTLRDPRGRCASWLAMTGHNKGDHCCTVAAFDDSHVVALHLLEPATFETSGRVGVEVRQAVPRTDSGDTQSRTGNKPETAGAMDERTGQAESAEVIGDEGEKVGAPDTN